MFLVLRRFKPYVFVSHLIRLFLLVAIETAVCSPPPSTAVARWRCLTSSLQADLLPEPDNPTVPCYLTHHQGSPTRSRLELIYRPHHQLQVLGSTRFSYLQDPQVLDVWTSENKLKFRGLRTSETTHAVSHLSSRPIRTARLSCSEPFKALQHPRVSSFKLKPIFISSKP